MTKILYASVIALALANCNNAPKAEKGSDEQTGNPSTPATAVVDTAVGIPGSETAKFDGTMFIYEAAQLKVTASESVGDLIEINGMVIPAQEADFFAGVHKNFLLLDNGTSPNGRILKIWSITDKKVIFETPYEGDLSIQGDQLLFIQPIDLQKVKLSKPVKCPDAAEWEKSGLGVGYGIPSAYDFAAKAATAKGDVTCFAVQ